MTKSLIVYTGVPVALEDPLLESELEGLERELDQVNQRIKDTSSFINEGIARLNGRKSRIVTNINILDVEIKELTRESHELREGPRQEHEPFAEETAEEEHPTEEEYEVNKKALKAECKKLYRRIASLSHPDKVDDAEKNKLFNEASEAFETLNLVELERIASKLFTKKRDLRSLERLRKRFNMLKQDLDLKIKFLDELKNSNNHRIVHLYTYGDDQGRAQALSTYETHLREQLFVRQRTVERLREYVGRLRAARDARKGGYTVTVTYIGGSGSYTYVTPTSDG